MHERARHTAPAETTGLQLRLEDWILIAVFSLFPLIGLAIGPGDGLSLAGVAVLIWVGHRAPVSLAMREAHRALGISIVLVLLCLFLPSLAAASTRTWLSSWLPGLDVVQLMRLGLVAALVVAFLREKGPIRPWMRPVDRVAFAAVLCGGGLALGLWRFADSDAAMTLIELVLWLGIVYGIHRVHLLRTRALPVLTRAALFGVSGAVVVASLG
jgi:hypothetical protein